MAFSGKYEMASQNNLKHFMKAHDAHDDIMDMALSKKSSTEIEQNGDHFKITTTTGSKKIINTFTIGKEAEIDTITGEKLKTVFYLDGNKITAHMKGQHEFHTVTELRDNELVFTTTLGDIVLETISKRV